MICSILVMALVVSFSAGCSTYAQLKAKAKLSVADTQRIASATVPGGAINESELEKEKSKQIPLRNSSANLREYANTRT